MGDTTASSPKQKVLRIGVLLGDLDKLNLIALKFLVLRMNMLQHTFEYEFLPVPHDKFTLSLCNQAVIDRDEVDREAPAFLTRYKDFLREESTMYESKELPPNYFVFVTLACFSDNYYTTISTFKYGLGILALGNWKRNMAPPSLLEFILMGIVGAAAILVSPSLLNSYHLGTKGCLFDITPALSEVRFKVLNGFICNYCHTALDSDGFGELTDEVTHILGKEWLGKSTDPLTPAGITAKLGYDLFITKGLKTTPWENILITIQQEGVKQLLTLIVLIIAAILIALLTLWLGLKK